MGSYRIVSAWISYGVNPTRREILFKSGSEKNMLKTLSYVSLAHTGSYRDVPSTMSLPFPNIPKQNFDSTSTSILHDTKKSRKINYIKDVENMNFS